MSLRPHDMFHAFKRTTTIINSCCVSPPIDTKQVRHSPAYTLSVSVPIRYPSDKISAVVSFETGIKINRKYNKIPLKYEHTVHSSVWCPGCFPGTWRRDSWHFEVANLHLQLIMDLCPLHVLIIFPFFLPGASKRSGWRMPPAKRSAMGYHTA